MNKVMLMGRLTKDPEIQYSKNSNVPYVRGTLAINRKYNGEDKSDFINFIAFKKIAELMSTYKRKGDKIAITGQLECSSYEGNDGVKKYYTQIIVDDVEFISNRKASEELISLSQDETYELISEQAVPF